MGRKPKSTNKYISAKLRKEFDSFLLVDKDFKEEPSESLLRIYKKSKKIIHTIFNTQGQIESEDINDYVMADDEIRVKNSICDLVHTAPRDNAALQDELDAFYRVTRIYIYDNLLMGDLVKSKILIAQYFDNLERIIKNGLEETQYWDDPKIKTFEFEHLFILHSRNNKFLQLQHPVNFDRYLHKNQAYFKLASGILYSWHEFWKAHLPYLKELRALFASQGTFKLKDGITYQDKDFTSWLEVGLLKYIEPISPKMKDDAMLVKYLKYIILSGQHTKPQRKKK